VPNRPIQREREREMGWGGGINSCLACFESHDLPVEVLSHIVCEYIGRDNNKNIAGPSPVLLCIILVGVFRVFICPFFLRYVPIVFSGGVRHIWEDEKMGPELLFSTYLLC